MKTLQKVRGCLARTAPLSRFTLCCATAAALLLMATPTATAQTFYICKGSDTTTATQLDFTSATQQPQLSDSITLTPPAGQHYVGGDISMLTKYEQQGAQFLDRQGTKIADLMTYVRQQGWNTIRLRLFVDPSGSGDKAVIQDLDYVTTLARRVKDAGMLLMLDFHYSDTWADPAAQWTPAAWLAMSDQQLQAKIYEYTRDCLKHLCDAGAAPDLIQTGNEISYGMMWGAKGTSANRCYTNSAAANWNRFYALLRQATKACREVCPRAQIIIHSERVPNTGVLTDYYDRMHSQGIDYDIIGLSYYPYFHGKLSQLESALRVLTAKGYGKPIHIVETGYPWKWAVPGTTTDYSATYPYTNAGQRQFTADLISLLKKYPLVKGISWWYAEANAHGCSGDLNSGWYNASLFDNQTGRALDALYELQSFK